jgi:hypothetical protein
VPGHALLDELEEAELIDHRELGFGLDGLDASALEQAREDEAALAVDHVEHRVADLQGKLVAQ